MNIKTPTLLILSSALALVQLLFPIPTLGNDFCNLDEFYQLPDFSHASYVNRCEKGDIVRVKQKGAKKYCDKDLPVAVVSIYDRENSIIFECRYLDVEKDKQSKYYRWMDSEGNMQYTRDLPPRECNSRDCQRIFNEWSKQKTIEAILDEAVSQFRRSKQHAKQAALEEIRQSRPTILDYLKSEESMSLCLHFSATKDNPFFSRLAEIYNIENEDLVVTALKMELGDRLQVDPDEIEKLYKQPGSIWKGMSENLLNCSRPEPELIYENNDIFGAVKKQYIYEIKPNYEIIDTFNGKIVKITTEPLPP